MKDYAQYKNTFVKAKQSKAISNAIEEIEKYCKGTNGIHEADNDERKVNDGVELTTMTMTLMMMLMTECPPCTEFLCLSRFLCFFKNAQKSAQKICAFLKTFTAPYTYFFVIFIQLHHKYN